MGSLATRSGKYGFRKFRAFVTFTEYKPWLTVRQLCLLSGLSYYSLGRALPQWLRWAYVVRQVSTEYGTGDFVYMLTLRGQYWLRIAIAELPNAALWRSQLDAWRLSTRDDYGKLVSLPFREFVRRLAERIRQFEAENDKTQRKTD